MCLLDYSIYTFVVSEFEEDKFKKRKKQIKWCWESEKKAHTHLETIIETPVKFPKDKSKTLGGVARTTYLLPLHFRINLL